MMSPNKNKFEHIKEGFVTSVKKKKSDLKQAYEKLKKIIKKKKLDKIAEINLDGDGLNIEFKDGMLFLLGSASTNPKIAAVVQDVLDVIATLKQEHNIIIEGHTDDTPLAGSLRYPSNWELSSARAYTIMRNFHKRGVKDERISVRAFAHTRPKVPITGLKGEKLRKARQANRRVVIWIE